MPVQRATAQRLPTVTLIALPPTPGPRKHCPHPPEGVEFMDVVAWEETLGLAGPRRRFSPSAPVIANFLAARSRGEILLLLCGEADLPPEAMSGLADSFAAEPSLDALVGMAGRDEIGLLAVRRKAFMDAEGFCESAPPGADMLVDLQTRLRRRGAQLATTPCIPASVRRTEGIARMAYRDFLAGRGATPRDKLRALLSWPIWAIGAAATAIRDGGWALEVLAASARPIARACGAMLGAVAGGRGEPFDSPLLAEPSAQWTGPDSDNRPGVSVIVPVKADHGSVLLTLHALRRQEMDIPFEVLIAIEADVPLATRIRREFPGVIICPCKSGAGPGGARNAAMGVARGEYLAFTDADCVPERTWLRQIVSLCQSNHGRPVRGWKQMHHRLSCVARASQYAEEGTGRPRAEKNVPGLSGANMCIAASLVADPTCRFTDGLYGAEEIELLENLPPRDRIVRMAPRPEVREMRYDQFTVSLRRMFNLGYGSGSLRMRRSLRGSMFARHLVLAPLLVPARYLLTARRLVRCGAGPLADFLRLTPLVLAMLASYTAGFIRGARDIRRATRSDGSL